IFASLSSLSGAGNMFHGVAAVTPALRFTNHIWPTRGSFAINDALTPSRTFLLPSPDENLLYTWQAQYAQNGRFAVASHTGTGRIPTVVHALVPDFVGKVLPTFELQELGFTTDAAAGTITDAQGQSYNVGQAIDFQRFGGAISIINDKKISDLFTAHVSTTS